MELLEINTRVVHSGHGAAVVASLYGGDRYPYVVKFDSGYQDVYGPGEVEPLEGAT